MAPVRRMWASCQHFSCCWYDVKSEKKIWHGQHCRSYGQTTMAPQNRRKKEFSRRRKSAKNAQMEGKRSTSKASGSYDVGFTTGLYVRLDPFDSNMDSMDSTATVCEIHRYGQDTLGVAGSSLEQAARFDRRLALELLEERRGALEATDCSLLYGTNNATLA